MMIDIHCPICPDKTPFRLRYNPKFSDGSLRFIARKTPDQQHFRIVQCTVCGLVYANPIIPPQEIAALYRDSDFIVEPQLENMAGDYAANFRKIIPLIPGRQRLLEIGCANGLFLKEARALGFQEVYGFEPGRKAVEEASGDIRGCIINDQLRPGIFPDGHFDAVCFFQVFDHILYPNEFLRMAHTYLKPGGVIFSIHHNIRALMPALLGAGSSTYDISHIHLWDPATMRKILEKNQFRVHSIRNIANRYKADHVLRMLPLPAGLKRTARAISRKLNIAELNIKASVENMACTAFKI